MTSIDEVRQQIVRLEVERKQIEQALLESKRYLTRLIESSPDAIISTDKDGNIKLFSESAEALLGYRAKEITGRSMSVLYGDDAGARQVTLEMRKRGGSVSCLETMMLAKDGSDIPVSVSASVLVDDKGGEAGTIGFVRDLRERKRLEDALEERGTDLRAARERFQYVLTVTPGVIYRSIIWMKTRKPKRWIFNHFPGRKSHNGVHILADGGAPRRAQATTRA
jgi:PAS domain S-box-containing protein